MMSPPVDTPLLRVLTDGALLEGALGAHLAGGDATPYLTESLDRLRHRIAALEAQVRTMERRVAEGERAHGLPYEGK